MGRRKPEAGLKQASTERSKQLIIDEMGAVEQGKSSHKKEGSTAIDDRLQTANCSCAREDHKREATTQPPHLYARAGDNYNHSLSKRQSL